MKNLVAVLFASALAVSTASAQTPAPAQKPAAAPPAQAAPKAEEKKELTDQQKRMGDCSKQASDKGMKGDDRNKFMSACLKGGGDKTAACNAQADEKPPRICSNGCPTYSSTWRTPPTSSSD